MHMECDDPQNLHVDNKFAISLTKNPLAHGRSKHIDTKCHFIRDQVNKRRISVEYCNTDDQVADILTKLLKIERFIGLIGIQSVVILN